MIRLGPSLSPSIDQRPTQGLAMTTGLAQAIGLLSLDAAGIDALVAEHVERNPFLSHARERTHGALSAIEDVTAGAPSPHAELERQVALAFRSPADRALAMALVAELDDAGYLRATDDDLAAQLGVPAGRIARVVAACRTFEPHGLFARDLVDCLALQLDATGDLDDAMRAVLGALDALASGDRVALAARTGLGGTALDGRIARLRRCDPKPGAGRFALAPVVRPVARIVRDERDGGWKVQLIGAANPGVLVDDALAALAATDAAARDYARATLDEARWLQRALRRRAVSVALVVGELARAQSDYLERGADALRPLSMRAVGEATGLHESTVSRVCAAKSVETPHGTIALRTMFGSGVAAGSGALAASAVRLRIGRLIEAETPGRALSDDAIAASLRADGVEIARRTVAKYREAMSIAPSGVRRRAARHASAEIRLQSGWNKT